MLRATILDNSAVSRGLLRTILAAGGHNVIAESGVIAANIPRLILNAPQLVFISFDMENADAQAILPELRQGLPKALLFAMSSTFTADMIKSASELGVNSFIVKPFRGAAVIASIRSAVLNLVKQQNA